jgi:hypothetical protein
MPPSPPDSASVDVDALVSVGFGEAATAVHNAAVALDPSASLFPGHSTDAEAARP